MMICTRHLPGPGLRRSPRRPAGPINKLVSNPTSVIRPRIETIPPRAHGITPRTPTNAVVEPPLRDTNAEVAPPLPSRQFGGLARLLNSDKIRYGGELWYVFPIKLAVFVTSYARFGIFSRQCALAFSAMPCSRAADFYYRRICKAGIVDLTIVINMVQSNVETPETKPAYIFTWRDPTFLWIRKKTPDKTRAEVAGSPPRATGARPTCTA
ncbi:glycosyl transferase [Colletotrichum tofieldiae]|nr:glycosyl transferase [Colletotrichum tofieldiae]GKT81400.1 glycosyl transferase [Colletotrichum tofieldiae]